MTQSVFYMGLDVLGTVFEAWILYTCNKIFCKDTNNRVLKLLLYITNAIFVFVLTWIIPVGMLKILIVAVYFVTLYHYLLKASWKNVITAFIIYDVLVILSDFAALIITDAAWGHTSILVGNNVVNIWQYYLIKFILSVVIVVILRKYIGEFYYEVQCKDTITILMYGIVIFGVLIYSTGRGFFEGDVNYFDYVAGISGVLFGILILLIFLYQKNSTYLKQQKNIAEQQVREMEVKYAYYEDKLNDERRIREIYHDLKNHLLVMEHRQNIAETRQMAETLLSQIADYEDYVHTGNEFLDIILKDKAAKAREKQIDFSALVDFKGIDFMKPLDISTIFGNAIDNAMEASEQLPEDQRLITVKAERVRNMLIITVENNTLPGKQPAEGTTKKDCFVHGFGIPNIKKAVEKYDGQCSFRQGDGTYLVKILIPIP